jgi:hypothetical protein
MLLHEILHIDTYIMPMPTEFAKPNSLHRSTPPQPPWIIFPPWAWNHSDISQLPPSTGKDASRARPSLQLRNEAIVQVPRRGPATRASPSHRNQHASRSHRNQHASRSHRNQHASRSHRNQHASRISCALAQHTVLLLVMLTPPLAYRSALQLGFESTAACTL